MELLSNANDFVDNLKWELKELSKKVDDGFKANESLSLDRQGRPVLKKVKGKKEPPEVQKLKAVIKKKMPEYSLLDVLHRVNAWTSYTKNFYPVSGSEDKLSDALSHYLFTVFGYGTMMGPAQTEKHTRNPISRRVIARINAQHIDDEKLQKSMVNIINTFNGFDLAHIWGNASVAIADGTHIELTENNLLGERHIRYGAYGGIAYHHISDTYIALFSHFIACGVWEAVYILDGLMKNTSDMQPDKIHADTQGQNATAFGLSYLLGIELMPRIRNFKDLDFYKTDQDVSYKHIDALFTKVIDWELIRLHWQDLVQVAISIQEGKVLPSFILQKLGANGRKTKLYKAFRELGRVKRTLFLLNYIDGSRFRKAITSATVKIESFNSFCDWITFGGQVIMTGDPVEQEKRGRNSIYEKNNVKDFVFDCLFFANSIQNNINKVIGQPKSICNKLVQLWFEQINKTEIFS